MTRPARLPLVADLMLAALRERLTGREYRVLAISTHPSRPAQVVVTLEPVR